ncbi:hypothetical protein BH23CHL1_BH23CHL1_14730 [soil metagenome]
MPSLRHSELGQRINSNKLELALLSVLCLTAFFAAAWVSQSVFDRVPHTEDESAFLFQAQTIASGKVVATEPERPEFFSIPFIILRDGMWFGKYPLGFPLVLALGVLTGHPWLTNATLAALCVLAIYLLSRKLYGHVTAMFAAVMLVASPFFLLQAGSMLSHIASLFWTLLFLVLFPLARRQRGVALSLATGAAIGMLFISRPLTAVGIAIPYVVWSLLTIARQRRMNRSYVIMASGALPFFVIFLAYNAITTGSAIHTAYELWWPFDRLGFGADIGVNGHDLDDGIRNTRVNSNALATFLFGWPGRLSMAPAIIAVILSLITLLGRLYRRKGTRSTIPPHSDTSPESWDLILASVVLSLVAIHILYWTPGQMYGPRYYMEAIGPLVILSARGFMQIGATVAVMLMNLAPKVRYPIVTGHASMLVLLVVLSVYAFTQTVPGRFDEFREWNGINGDGVAIVEVAQIDNALVFIARSSWVDYAPFFAQNVPTLDSAVVYASDRGPQQNRVLMDLYPGREFYRYEDGRLVRLDPQR